MRSIPYENTLGYRTASNRTRMPVAIGEFKRGILNPGEWQRGNIVSSLQTALSRELRGSVLSHLEDNK